MRRLLVPLAPLAPTLIVVVAGSLVAGATSIAPKSVPNAMAQPSVGGAPDAPEAPPCAPMPVASELELEDFEDHRDPRVSSPAATWTSGVVRTWTRHRRAPANCHPLAASGLSAHRARAPPS